MSLNRAAVFLSLFFVCLTRAVALDPAWHTVLSGEILAGPKLYGSRSYTVTSDRSLTCVDAAGRFLWSAPLPGRPAGQLCVTSGGLVLTVGENGTISAYNQDGAFVWRMNGSSVPLISPHEGRDGRLFIVYHDSLICLSPSARIKWKLNASFEGTSAFSETADGDLLLFGTRAIRRVTPYGEFRETIPLDGDIIAVQPISGGFAASLANGAVLGFDVRDFRQGVNRPTSERVWSFAARQATLALGVAGDALLAYQADGTLVALNPTDGIELWRVQLPSITSRPIEVRFEYDQIYVLAPQMICAVSRSGTMLWSQTLTGSSGSSSLATDGFAFSGDGQSTLYGYKAESRIQGEKKQQNRETYGILKGRSAEFGTPPLLRTELNRQFLDSVHSDLETETVGIAEIEYARRLAEILDGADSDPSERGRAATLLGMLGSEEYRRFLCDRATQVRDVAEATGILFGLAYCGPDGDGSSLAAITALLGTAWSRDDAIPLAACDSLYSVIRYSGGTVALEGVKTLSRCLESPYSDLVRNRARMTLRRILE